MRVNQDLQRNGPEFLLNNVPSPRPHHHSGAHLIAWELFALKKQCSQSPLRTSFGGHRTTGAPTNYNHIIHDDAPFTSAIFLCPERFALFPALCLVIFAVASRSALRIPNSFTLTLQLEHA
jgi:hypothetical protein